MAGNPRTGVCPIRKGKLQETVTRTGEMIPEIPRGSIPTFSRKKVMFGALKEEQSAISPEWSKQLSEIYESLRRDRESTEILQRMLHQSEEEMKMKRIRRFIQGDKDDWRTLKYQMREAICGDGFYWNEEDEAGVGTPEMREKWEKALLDLEQRTDAALNLNPIQEGIKSIPEYLAQWDWYVRRREEAMENRHIAEVGPELSQMPRG
jgi:hypothetical protein